MDLWIRSQNKEILVKTDEIKIEREYIDFKDKEIFHINTAYDELGKYSAKERALEVLDEINEFIERYGTIATEIDENGDVINVEYHKKVYEMPLD